MSKRRVRISAEEASYMGIDVSHLKATPNTSVPYRTYLDEKQLKELSEFSFFYKLIFKFYPFSKLILYFNNSILYLINSLGFKIEPPKFHALFKYLKVN